MEFDFETLVKRRPANLKYAFTHPEVVASGNISFDGAEPDYPSAPVVRDALVRFAENGLFGFTMCDDVYRKAVVWWMKESRRTEIEPEWIVSALGTIYSVATAIRLCVKEDQGIIITPPIYNRYKQAADRLNRKTMSCPLLFTEGEGYRMDFAAIEEAMKSGEYPLFLLCNPHNPIGCIWKADELAKLAELANRYDVTVFSDEIFADNCYEGRECPCYLDIPGARKHAIVSTSLGKAFGFTGVNHANMIIADETLRKRFADRRTRDHYGSLDPMVYECLLGAYTPEGKAWVDASNCYVEENIRLIRRFFEKEMPEVTVYGGEGGYILWLDWRKLFSSEEEQMDFLIKEAHFELGPGEEYGQPGFTRMCVASPRWCIEKVLGDLKKAWEKKQNA